MVNKGRAAETTTTTIGLAFNIASPMIRTKSSLFESHNAVSHDSISH